MHDSPVLLTDSRGDVYRQTPNGLERVPQPYYYRPLHMLLSVATRAAAFVHRVV